MRGGEEMALKDRTRGWWNAFGVLVILSVVTVCLTFLLLSWLQSDTWVYIMAVLFSLIVLWLHHALDFKVWVSLMLLLSLMGFVYWIGTQSRSNREVSVQGEMMSGYLKTTVMLMKDPLDALVQKDETPDQKVPTGYS